MFLFETIYALRLTYGSRTNEWTLVQLNTDLNMPIAYRCQPKMKDPPHSYCEAKIAAWTGTDRSVIVAARFLVAESHFLNDRLLTLARVEEFRLGPPTTETARQLTGQRWSVYGKSSSLASNWVPLLTTHCHRGSTDRDWQTTRSEDHPDCKWRRDDKRR